LSIVNELAEHLKSLNYIVILHSEHEIRVLHPSLPIYLQVEVRNNFVYMTIKHGEGLREVLEDLRDSGEDIENTIEEVLSYLSVVSLKVRKWVEERGYVSVFKLRDGSLEIYEMLEELLEEEEY
ncbi:MAG: hypothetical protein QXD40_05500, partial [Desulfurococcaceae archaeon]